MYEDLFTVICFVQFVYKDFFAYGYVHAKLVSKGFDYISTKWNSLLVQLHIISDCSIEEERLICLQLSKIMKFPKMFLARINEIQCKMCAL